MAVKHTVLPDGQPPTVAFTVHAQQCGPMANASEMGAALFSQKTRALTTMLITCLKNTHTLPLMYLYTKHTVLQMASPQL